MQEYRVIWEIDLYAINPKHAARCARDIQRRHDTTATVFTVVENPTGNMQNIDLINEQEYHHFETPTGLNHYDQNMIDKLFITEALNDLHRNGFVPGGKAETLLHDWAIELRAKSRTSMAASRLRKTFNHVVGQENW